MSSDPFIMHGPVEIDIKVHITDGTNTGVVTVSVGRGKFPTNEQIQAAIADAEEAASGKTPGFRLMTKREFWDHLCQEKFGGLFAMPGGEEWDFHE